MKNLLYRGDVIRTNPIPDYWGIAVVLTECSETSESDPMCHIALTNHVFHHEVDFEELQDKKFDVLIAEGRNPLNPVPESDMVIGVYSRILNESIPVIGKIDPTSIYKGPLPFSPDYGLEITWPLCGSVDKNLGMQAITNWLRANAPADLDRLFGGAEVDINTDDVIPEDELWVMIKMNQYFRSLDEKNIEESLIGLIESAKLGEFDGHSSGAYQFDLNFFEVTNYEKAKKAVTKYLAKHYPELEYEISNTYETTFDNK